MSLEDRTDTLELRTTHRGLFVEDPIAKPRFVSIQLLDREGNESKVYAKFLLHEKTHVCAAQVREGVRGRGG